MLVIVAGGGRTGTHLTNQLLAQNYDVHVIEDRRDVLSRIHRELPTEVIYEGNVLDPEVLEQAGIKEANALAAVTTDDEVNLALCYMARKVYNIHRTIARVNNPRNAWLFDKKLFVDVAVNQAEIMAHLIEEEMSMGDMMTLLKLRRGNLSVVEEKIPEGAKAIGVAIKDIGLSDHCVIAAIIRKGEVMVPRGVTIFQVGDEVLAVTNQDGANQLRSLFENPTRKNSNK